MMTANAPTDPLIPVPTSGILAALERCWAKIRQRHPQVPDVVMILGPGDLKPGQVKFGHWSPARWTLTDGTRPEVLITGECFELGAAETVGVLLHEAAHGLAWARKINDTSRQGRYHNTDFRILAEELGLAVKKDAVFGFNDTSMTKAALDVYEAEIRDLDVAHHQARRAKRGSRLGFWLLPPGPRPDSEEEEGGEPVEGSQPDAGEPEPKRRSRVTLVCECDEPRRIQVAPGVAVKGAIRCGVCRQDFAETEP